MEGAGLCDIDEKGRIDASALSMANVGGVFVVLAVGLLLSVIGAVVEFAWNERRHPLTASDSSKVNCFHSTSHTVSTPKCYCANLRKRKIFTDVLQILLRLRSVSASVCNR